MKNITSRQTRRRDVFDNITVEQISKMCEETPLTEVAKEVGISYNNMYNYCVRNNISFIKRHRSVKDDNTILERMIVLLSQDFSPFTIHEVLRLPRDYVYNVIRNYNAVHNRDRK